MNEHFFTPDAKEWLLIIGFIFTLLVAPVVRSSVKRLISDKETRDNERQLAITKSLTTFKKDVLFMFDNHGHDIVCDGTDCGTPRTGKTYITIPPQRRDDD